MKKKIIVVAALIFSALCGYAFAQVTATQIVPGYLTTSGCPGSAYVCWLPYTTANPLPVGVQ